jgi:glycosyltransferase involved in cell wall biosynthesis
MKVAYAYEHRADDIDIRSGYPFFMLRELEKRTSVRRIFPLKRAARYAFAPKYMFYRWKGQGYMPDREPILLKYFAQQLASQLSSVEADCIFAPNSCVASHLKTNLPVVFCTDATFAGMLDFYGEFSNCPQSYQRMGHEQERRALETCAAAIYTSTWAAQSAIETYGADPNKIHILPFGANVQVPPIETVRRAITARRSGPFRVLFIGKEYRRKGADIVLAACDIANRNGAALQLDLVGLKDLKDPLPSYVTNHGNLTKRDPAQRAKLEELLMDASLLFVPSRAEAFGIVFCEAACHGVPSLTFSIGGIPNAVRHGTSGLLMPSDATAEAFAAALQHLASNRDEHDMLSHSAREHYDRCLSWDVFGDGLVNILRKVSGNEAM